MNVAKNVIRTLTIRLNSQEILCLFIRRLPDPGQIYSRVDYAYSRGFGKFADSGSESVLIDCVRSYYRNLFIISC